MPDYARVGAGHLAALMHMALDRGDAATLAALRSEVARRTAAEQEMCRREWIRQCPLRKVRRRAGKSVPWELAGDTAAAVPASHIQR